MSIFDKVKSMLGDHSAKAEELAKQGVDQAARMAKEKTGGKYDRHIDTAAAKAKEMADRIDEPDGTPRPPGQDASPGYPGQGRSDEGRVDPPAV
ncbi:antitoxin [Streptosporangium sp. NPDC020145]|uniref:antitoxin n=1 Tax=Streptosporangium sp. NPDC020145 TaxID=3154694 RepID=UPI0034305F20